MVDFLIAGPALPRWTNSSRPQIFEHLAQPRYLVVVRWIAQRFLERVGIPFLHGTGAQQAIGVGHRARIEAEAIGLDSKRDRRKEGVDRRECIAREERTTEAAQTIDP